MVAEREGGAVKTRNYYEIFVLFIAVGFAASWGLTNTGEVTSVFPAWARMVWFSGLAVGAAVAVVGEMVFTNTALVIERAALLFLTGLIMAYTLAFIIVGIRISSPGHVAYVGFALVVFAAVNYLRARQINKQVRSVYQVYDRLPSVGTG
jgi:hypothetical protein